MVLTHLRIHTMVLTHLRIHTMVLTHLGGGAQLPWGPSYPWVGRVGFQISPDCTRLTRVLEPKCHSCDIEAVLAGYGIAMCVVCVLFNISEFNKQWAPPPRLNELLTPRACQALLAYTLTLGEPLLVDALSCFCTACCVSQVCYQGIDHLSLDLLWVCHGNLTYSRVSAGIQPALYSPMHSIHKSRL